MTAPAVATMEPVRVAANLNAAYRLLWLALVVDVLAFGIGFPWDRRWHATHAFEDFSSPPHLFIYSMHLCATITLAYIAFTPDLRRWFGPLAMTALAGLAMPVVTGIVDLALRARIP
jgi:hypothetical protein